MIVPYNYMQNLMIVIVAYVAYCNYVYLVIGTKRRRIWTRDMFDKNERDMHGFYTKVFSIIKERDLDQFRKLCRMGVTEFESLLKLLEERLTKHSIRSPIEAECRLVLTLVFLSQGCSWLTLSCSFKMGVSTVRKIILDTCDAIWDELQPIYLPAPTEADWKKISIDIYNMSGMPNCAGPIDGRHIKIKCSSNNNYRSIVLLATCDTNYCFTAVDIGGYEGTSFKRSGFSRQILNKTINLPSDEVLPNSNIVFPYYFVGDKAFPLKEHLMRPYRSENALPNSKETFNDTLSSVCNKLENTFGVMAARWRVLLDTINCFPENAEKIIRAIVVLHNFAQINDDNYCPLNYVDHINSGELVEGLWRQEKAYLPKFKLNTRFNASRSIFRLRDTLKDYIFNQ